MRKRNTDMVDLVTGIGIGLCFSTYWKVGILLIVLCVMVAEVQLSKEKKEKLESSQKNSSASNKEKKR